jgi:hypothetical protein
MFIISFFTGSIIRMIFGFVLLIGVLFVAFVVAVGALAATGDPGECEPGGGPISVDAVNAASWQQKWDAMVLALDGGQPSSATFTESELSSRADEYLRDHDVGFENPRVCVHDGSGEASATFGWLGIDINVKARGTVDLTGDHPDAEVEEMEIGNIPGWMAAPVEGLVNRALDAALDDADLDHDYAPVLRPGEATVSGTP